MNTMVGKEAPETFSRGSEIPPSIWLATMQQPMSTAQAFGPSSGHEEV